MRPSQVKIGLAVLFVTIIVPLLTVSILRGYLEYLWARKNDEEFSGFANTTIFDILKDLKNFFWNKYSSHCMKWHCILLLMWPLHHHFQMIFTSQMRLFPCIIAYSMILYQLTLKLAWYQSSFLTFQIGTCPKPPRFDGHEEGWLLLGLFAFIVLSWDNLIIMRVLDMLWCR